MSVEDKVGQMLVSSFQSDFMSTDSDEFDLLVEGDPRLPDRRIPRVRRNRGDSARPPQSNLRLGHARSAARGRIAPQPTAGDRPDSAAQHRRLRGRRRLSHRRGDVIPAPDGIRRGPGRKAGGGSRTRHRRGSARPRRSRELRAGRRREQQSAQPGHQHPIVW